MLKSRSEAVSYRQQNGSSVWVAN